MKILLAPDAFKGSLTAREAADAMREGLLGVRPDTDVVLHPMADGGEGTLDVLRPCLGGTILGVDIPGMDETLTTVPVLQFCTKDNQKAWLIESALAVGLTLPSVRSIPVLERTSMPLGRLIRMGLDAGIRCIYLALGGSATNDGGIGLLAACGMRLRDGSGAALAPRLSSMNDAHQVDISAMDSRIFDTELHLVPDVDNPLLGEGGATETYGPQKGMSIEDVAQAETWMQRWARLAESAFGCRVSHRAAAGAAGGLGFALQLPGATVHAGAVWVAKVSGLDDDMAGCDWVITGEGGSDVQTLSGKAPKVVADAAARAGVRACLMSGIITAPRLFQGRFADIRQVTPMGMPPSQAMAQAHKLLVQSAGAFARQYG